MEREGTLSQPQPKFLCIGLPVPAARPQGISLRGNSPGWPSFAFTDPLLPQKQVRSSRGMCHSRMFSLGGGHSEHTLGLKCAPPQIWLWWLVE